MKTYYFKDNQSKSSIRITGGKINNEQDIDIHEHNFSEIVYIKEGTAQHIINDTTYNLLPGDIYVINGHTSHGFQNINNLLLYNISYQPNIFNNNLMFDFKKLPGFQALFILEPNYRDEIKFKSKMHLAPSQRIKVNKITKEMLNEFKSHKIGYQTLLLASFLELVVYLSRNYTDNIDKSNNQIIDFAHSVSYIENNYREDIKLEELANVANMSPRHYTKIYKKNYKLSPIKYVINLRLKHACELLLNTDKTITEIAYDSGFNDHIYFNKYFKKYFGLTPGKYRKKNQQGQ